MYLFFREHETSEKSENHLRNPLNRRNFVCFESFVFSQKKIIYIRFLTRTDGIIIVFR